MEYSDSILGLIKCQSTILEIAVETFSKVNIKWIFMLQKEKWQVRSTVWVTYCYITNCQLKAHIYYFTVFVRQQFREADLVPTQGSLIRLKARSWPESHLKAPPRKDLLLSSSISCENCFQRVVVLKDFLRFLLPSWLCWVLAWGHPWFPTTQTSPTWWSALSRGTVCPKTEATSFWVMVGIPLQCCQYFTSQEKLIIEGKEITEGHDYQEARTTGGLLRGSLPHS